MNQDHIVEVYAAADLFEAETLRDLLDEAGIQAQVIGSEVRQTEGSVPEGGVTLPRVCVHEQDMEEAARLIEQWLSEKADRDDLANESDRDDQEDDETAPAEVEGMSALGKLLMLFGLGCILLGASFAWSNYQELQKCSGFTEASRVQPWIRIVPPLHPETNLPMPVDVSYEYQVNGQKYSAMLAKASNPNDAPATVPIHYNPGNPGEHLLGELPSIWLPLAFGGFFGLLLMFIVYRLN